MDMKELFDNGCFMPDWTEQASVYKEESPVPQRKDIDTLYDELAEIKANIESLQERQWYLARKIEYHKYGFTNT